MVSVELGNPWARDDRFTHMLILVTIDKEALDQIAYNHDYLLE